MRGVTWETIGEKTAGRPARRYYRLTELGLQNARAEPRDEQQFEKMSGDFEVKAKNSDRHSQP